MEESTGAGAGAGSVGTECVFCVVGFASFALLGAFSAPFSAAGLEGTLSLSFSTLDLSLTFSAAALSFSVKDCPDLADLAGALSIAGLLDLSDFVGSATRSVPLPSFAFSVVLLLLLPVSGSFFTTTSRAVGLESGEGVDGGITEIEREKGWPSASLAWLSEARPRLLPLLPLLRWPLRSPSLLPRLLLLSLEPPTLPLLRLRLKLFPRPKLSVVVLREFPMSLRLRE